jgi:hypothetical protein
LRRDAELFGDERLSRGVVSSVSAFAALKLRRTCFVASGFGVTAFVHFAFDRLEVGLPSEARDQPAFAKVSAGILRPLHAHRMVDAQGIEPWTSPV